ncbi:ABC-2 type transport system ATP-binding protein [Paenibacillus amylolyticus]|uniref:ABC-2 type transport system ATP-binding protein n=1 Tax=Paenibacillus amylolyticus TaxID=1451 RepID=A0AAP5H3A4_PAEAM|nr:ATP-binding cassette domain-containing protein [Paenibacillus amylolyticus]MDR6725012.1 ABC-2 type transport system ATP-binding protein [Paenibacillus amylolyticus]
MLEVKQVSKVYDGQRGVHQLDFTMERGEIVGFLGPNGAGKTTTMRMITGYLQPTTGSITVDGVSVHEQGRSVRSKIGYLPETPPLYPDMTVQSYLKFIANLRDVAPREVKLRVSEMMSRLGLQGREKQIIRGLSKGYKQRLGLAGAIIHKPDLLVLDEPTSGLDPNQIIEIRDLIRELGENHTVLLSTHILPEVSAICNRMLIINQGQLVLDGSPQHFGSAMGDQFKVAIEVKATEEQLHNLLTPWEKIRSEVISPTGVEGEPDSGTVKMLLTGESSEDFREELFYLLSGAGLPILEMKKENLSLEQIFLKLTTTETQAEVVSQEAEDNLAGASTTGAEPSENQITSVDPKPDLVTDNQQSTEESTTVSDELPHAQKEEGSK